MEGGRREGGKARLTCVFRDVLGGRVESLFANDAPGSFDLKKVGREGERAVGRGKPAEPNKEDESVHQSFS